MVELKKQYGIYSVDEYPEQNGKWGGYKVAAIASTGKQGKLYPRTDGRENYQAKPKDEDLEI
jgi:hypothetical protein